jgi:hypothetical protein
MNDGSQAAAGLMVMVFMGMWKRKEDEDKS